MEVLDVISKDMKKDTKDLKEQLRNQEANYGSELHDWNKRIEDATDELCCKIFQYARHFFCLLPVR